MNDTFTHSSDLMYLFFAPMFISLALFSEMKKYSLYLSALMGLIFLLCLLGFIFSFISVWRFDADDDMVIFKRYMLPKKRTIRYQDIKKIKVTRYNIKARGNVSWVETIHFILNDDSELCFSANLPVDYKNANYPMYMEVQFNSSKFMKLKKYIESKMEYPKEVN